jgi:hypothetical protein
MPTWWWPYRKRAETCCLSFDSLHHNKVLLCFVLPTLYHRDIVIAHNGDESVHIITSNKCTSVIIKFFYTQSVPKCLDLSLLSSGSYFTSKMHLWQQGGLWNVLKFAPKMTAVIIKFIVAVENWLVRCGVFSIIYYYNGTYQEDVKFVLVSSTLFKLV